MLEIYWWLSIHVKNLDFIQKRLVDFYHFKNCKVDETKEPPRTMEAFDKAGFVDTICILLDIDSTA